MLDVIILGNLGEEFDVSDVVNQKIHVKLGTGMSRAADGTVTIDLAALVTHGLALAGASLTSDVNGVSGSLDLTPAVKAAETLTTWNYDPASHMVTYSGEDGVAKTSDLSSLTTDIYIDGFSWDAPSMTLTLTDNDGDTPDVVVNLSELKKVATADSATVAFSGTGETSDPLTATVKASTATAGNLLTTAPDGLAVDPVGVKALATVEVRDAFGNHLFYALP